MSILNLFHRFDGDNRCRRAVRPLLFGQTLWNDEMDHFRGIVCDLLEANGYWVRRSFKVELTRAEKRRAGRPSMPQPEIDILAFKRETDEVMVIEAKAGFSSAAASLDSLSAYHERPEGRYKLFTCQLYREVILERLRIELLKSGMISTRSTLRLGLAAGKVRRGESNAIRELMDSRGWYFLSPEDIRNQVVLLSRMGHKSNSAIITAKLLMADS